MGGKMCPILLCGWHGYAAMRKTVANFTKLILNPRATSNTFSAVGMLISHLTFTVTVQVVTLSRDRSHPTVACGCFMVLKIADASHRRRKAMAAELARAS